MKRLIYILLGLVLLSCHSRVDKDEPIISTVSRIPNDTVSLSIPVDSLMYLEGDPFEKDDNLLGFYTFKNCDTLLSLLFSKWGLSVHNDSDIYCHYIFCNEFAKHEWKKVNIDGSYFSANVYREKKKYNGVALNFIAFEFLQQGKNVLDSFNTNYGKAWAEIQEIMDKIKDFPNDKQLLETLVEIDYYFEDRNAKRIIKYIRDNYLIDKKGNKQGFYLQLSAQDSIMYWRFDDEIIMATSVMRDRLKHFHFPILTVNGVKMGYHFSNYFEWKDEPEPRKLSTNELLKYLDLTKVDQRYDSTGKNKYWYCDSGYVHLFEINDSLSAFVVCIKGSYTHAGIKRRSGLTILTETERHYDGEGGGIEVADVNFDGAEDVLFNYFTDFRGNAYYSLFINNKDGSFIEYPDFEEIRLPIIDGKRKCIYSVYSAAAEGDNDYKGVYKWVNGKLIITDWVIWDLQSMDPYNYDLLHYKYSNGYKYLSKKVNSADYKDFDTYLFNYNWTGRFE